MSNRSIDADDVAETYQFVIITAGDTHTPNFRSLRDQMLADGNTCQFIVIQLLQALLDGMRYGDWPKNKTTDSQVNTDPSIVDDEPF